MAGVPVPEAAAAAGERVERATQAALKEAAGRGLAGAEVTPFLLQRIRELTGGASLDANIALIKHNAAVGSQIAVALASAAWRFWPADEAANVPLSLAVQSIRDQYPALFGAAIQTMQQFMWQLDIVSVAHFVMDCFDHLDAVSTSNQPWAAGVDV